MKKYLIILSISLISIGLAPLASTQASSIADKQEMTEKEQKNVETIRKLIQGFVEGNTAQINELVHEDFINHHAPEGIQNRAGFHKIVEQVHGAFSTLDSFSLKPLHIFSKGDYVAMIDVGEGRRNGKQYNHVDIHVFIMKDGKMYQHWNSFGLPSQQEILMKFMEETK